METVGKGSPEGTAVLASAIQGPQSQNRVIGKGSAQNMEAKREPAKGLPEILPRAGVEPQTRRREE